MTHIDHIDDGSADSMPTGPFGGEKNGGIGRFGGDGITEEFTTAHRVTTQRTQN
jgi:aldehyde dehydrogenase (NAD+)